MNVIFLLLLFITGPLCTASSQSQLPDASIGNTLTSNYKHHNNLRSKKLLSVGEESRITLDTVIDIKTPATGLPITDINPGNIDNDGIPISRTATGGFVHTIMVFLTVVAFIGNGAFMIYVFWLSK